MVWRAWKLVPLEGRGRYERWGAGPARKRRSWRDLTRFAASWEASTPSAGDDPSLLVSAGDGESGFLENRWVGRTLAIGGAVRLAVTDPCPRCVMATLALEDLPADPAILRTAARHNRVVGGEGRGREGVYAASVGVYARVLSGGAVRRGDPVRML